jgi:hypothetical protein
VEILFAWMSQEWAKSFYFFNPYQEGVDRGGRDIRLPLSASALFVNKTCDYTGPVHVHAPIMFTS